MKLTNEIKEKIDSWSYQVLLRKWRFAPAGDPIFEGESGEYFKNVLAAKRDGNPGNAVKTSKEIGR